MHRFHKNNFEDMELYKNERFLIINAVVICIDEYYNIFPVAHENIMKLE